jgi:hypothetical protein
MLARVLLVPDQREDIIRLALDYDDLLGSRRRADVH